MKCNMCGKEYDEVCEECTNKYMIDVGLVEQNEGAWLGYNFTPIYSQDELDKYSDLKMFQLEKPIGILGIEPIYQKYHEDFIVLYIDSNREENQ